eukprot:2945311-Rhodomonas_salina.1
MEGEDGKVHGGLKLGRSENLVPDGVLDNAKTKTAVITEMGLRMDNNEGAIEERAEEKEAKYTGRSSRVLLQESPAPGRAEAGEGIGVEGTACVISSRVEDLA